MRIAKEGRWYIVGAFIIGILLLAISISIFTTSLLVISLTFLLLTIFMMIFFRDPDRKIADGIVSPADGRVMEITRVKDREVGDAHRITIFMNIWNVHVNRSPIDGRVVSISHYYGKHLPAFFKNAIKNEHVVIVLETAIGKVKIVQIAGIVARRIVPYIRKGESIRKGERIGIIRFGSRVDLYLPASKTNIYVKENNLVKAGEDRIAEIRS